MVAAIAVALVAASSSNDGGNESARDGETDVAVREDSRRLSTGSSDVVFVEFLDFECEACRAAFPAIVELRATYGDQVTFVVRNFPLHNNTTWPSRRLRTIPADRSSRIACDIVVSDIPTVAARSHTHSSPASSSAYRIRTRFARPGA